MLNSSFFDMQKVKMSKKDNYYLIPLYGNRPELHDRFGNRGKDYKSYGDTLEKIRRLIKLGHREHIVINTDVRTADCVKDSNYFRLNGVLKIAKRFGIKMVQFNLINPRHRNLIASLDIVANAISKVRYVFLFDLLVKVKGLPYCLIPEPESVILKSERPQDFIKLKKCKICRYYQQCDGILKGYLKNLDKEKIRPQTLPKEVMIEVTPHCNFYCKFCFNRASFAQQGHGQFQEPSKAYIKKIIDAIKKAGVSIVRFTGGEPFLRNDIFDLIKYARSRSLKVRLNTNGSLIKNYKMAKELAKYLDYVLFSMHTYNAKKDERITGIKGSFEKKIRAIKWFKKAGVRTIRVSTIATMDNIRNLEKFYKLFKKLKVDKWATNRVIPLPGEKDVWGKKELKLLVEKLIKIRKDIVKNNISLKVHIVNGVPLCADDPVKMNAVCAGSRSVDGHERFAIDPRGFAKPIYYIEKNIGDPLDIKGCWNHPFMKTLRSYKSLPKECKKCALLEKCKGGNRYCAYVVSGSYKAPDPLMDFSNVKNFIW